MGIGDQGEACGEVPQHAEYRFDVRFSTQYLKTSPYADHRHREGVICLFRFVRYRLAVESAVAARML